MMGMTYVKVICVVVFLFTAAFTQAQDNLPAEKVSELTELHRQIRGTFQIQIEGTRKQQALTLSMVEQIENARSETEITFIPFGSQHRILILPRQTIEADGFKPIKLLSYSYTDEPAE